MSQADFPQKENDCIAVKGADREKGMETKYKRVSEALKNDPLSNAI